MNQPLRFISGVASRLLSISSLRCRSITIKAHCCNNPKVASELSAWHTMKPATHTVHSISRVVGDYLGELSKPSREDRKKRSIGLVSTTHKMSAILQWCYHSCGQEPNEETKALILAVFQEIVPYGKTIMKPKQWHHFCMHQFFLSKASLDAYIILAQLDSQGLNLPISFLIHEYCWRGRFKEALLVSERLPLSNCEKNEMVVLFHEYEQHHLVIRTYSLDRQKTHNQSTMDPFYLLHALKQLKRTEEFMNEVEQLSTKQRQQKRIRTLLQEI